MAFLGIGKQKAQEVVKAYMFTMQRTLIYMEKIPEKKDDNQLFYYNKLPYVVDLQAVQFFTEDKKPIYFYIENIPNPVIFDMKRYIQKFITAKRANPEANVYDDNKNLLDLSFASGSLEMYKNNNFLKKLLAPMTPEQAKIIYALIGIVGLAFVTIIVLTLFKH